MRGFLFSADALAAIIVILFLAVFVAGLGLTYTVSEIMYQRMYYVGKDLINIMDTARMSELQGFPSVSRYFSEGILTGDDMNKTLMDVIGSFWAGGNETHARGLAMEIFDSVLNGTGYGYELLMGDTVVYEKDQGDKNYLARLSTIVSGYEIGKPVSGYVSRAWAVDIRKNNTLVVMGDVISSSVRKPGGGNNNNMVNVTYNVSIPGDAVITDAWGFIETAWWDNKFKVYINGVEVPGGGGVGSSKLEGLAPFFHPGENTANVVGRFGSGGYEAGDDGATHWVINYNTSESQTKRKETVFYFQEVQSGSSIRYKKPLFITGDINSLLVRLNLSPDTGVQRVYLRFRWKGQEYDIGSKAPVGGAVEWSDTEIRNVLDSNDIGYSELNSRFFWFIADVDEYSSREWTGYGRRIVAGDSYVKVDYDANIEAPYGYIDLTGEIPLADYSDEDIIDDFYRYSEWGFNVTPESIPLGAEWQFAWLYWYGSDPGQRASANGMALYHHDPADQGSDPLIEEFARFGYTQEAASGSISEGMNAFELQFSQGYSVNPFNSMGVFTILIKNQVGYGDVFGNETAADDDAVQRLGQFLGPHITATNVVTDTSAISNVPSLWGPASLEVRVWK